MRKMMYRIPLKNKKNTFYNSQWSVGRSGGQRWSTDMIISFFKAILNEQKKEEGGGDMIQKYLNYTTASVLEIAQIIRTEDC